MPITSNKGEWAEFYAFLKILSERQLPAADENLSATEQFFVFQKVIRQDEKNTPVRLYDLTAEVGSIAIKNATETEILHVFNSVDLAEKTKRVFQHIKTSDKTFSIPVAEELMTNLLCTRIKASNEEKADLVAIIHDRISESSPMLGFSVKSMVGGAATLLNAGKTTNFVYEVTNFDGNIEEINSIDTKSKIRDRIALVQQSGGTFSFSHVADDQFDSNMRIIDTVLPDFIAHMLLDFFTGTHRTVAELVTQLAADETMQAKYRLSPDNYSYKLRNFLDAIALGMVPSKPWDGFMTAHGGYIIVKEDGEVVCYHLYNRDKFQMYLYNNTRFEAASSSRHNYGSLYVEDGRLFFNLNLQIRFLK